MTNRYALGALAAALILAPAFAEDPAGHGHPNHGWYERAELTAAARARIGQNLCCAHAEVVRTQFRVDRTSGDDEWWYLDRGTNNWRRIPADIIHLGVHAPDKQPTLFIWAGIATCFFVPEEGI